MEVFTGGRGSGKTYKLAHGVMDDENSVLVGEKLFVRTSLQTPERSDVAELVSRALDDFEIK